jgi:hypothetical protein
MSIARSVFLVRLIDGALDVARPEAPIYEIGTRGCRAKDSDQCAR